MRYFLVFFSLVMLAGALSSGCNRRGRTGPPPPPPPPTDAGGRLDTSTGMCTVGSCPTGQTCNTITGMCEDDTPENCLADGCPTGQTCNRTTGRCEADTGCTPGSCPVGQSCNTATGMCETTGCTPGSCPGGQTCNTVTGMCETTATCRSFPITDVPGTFCDDASTMTCIAGCADSTCLFGCLEGDSNPECAACANVRILDCATSMGCQMAWDCYNTCAEDAGCSDTSCADLNCPTQSMALSDCLGTVSCGSAWASCLPAS